MRYLATAVLVAVVGAGVAAAETSSGPDVILGQLGAPAIIDSASYDTKTGKLVPGTQVYFAAQTTSCNAGDKELSWIKLPNNRHPVIALNLYRLADGRMIQIGQSWLKHGFLALQDDACGFGCHPSPSSGVALGAGCSDPYGASLNRGPKLGSRGAVNPLTAEFDGPSVVQQLSVPTATEFDRSLQAASDDLRMPGAVFFIEGHYLTADDAKAGNGLNNVSYVPIQLKIEPGFRPRFDAVGPAVRTKPAILAWPGATFRVIDSVEHAAANPPLSARIILAAKVEDLSATMHRYDYAVYNMNSARGIRSISIPIGSAQIKNVGMSAVESHGEPWSNELWQSRIENGHIIWSVPAASDNENANAIRWGTTYNFWFETESAPVDAEIVLEKFMPGEGANAVSGKLPAPGG